MEQRCSPERTPPSTSQSTREPQALPPPAAGLPLRQERAGAVQVPGGRGSQPPQLADGLAHGAGVVRQALDVLEGQVDDLVAAGAAVEVAAGEALQPRLVGDAALAVGGVRAQGQRARQGAALQAAGLDGALLGGGPADRQTGSRAEDDQEERG